MNTLPQRILQHWRSCGTRVCPPSPPTFPMHVPLHCHWGSGSRTACSAEEPSQHVEVVDALDRRDDLTAPGRTVRCATMCLRLRHRYAQQPIETTHWEHHTRACWSTRRCRLTRVVGVPPWVMHTDDTVDPGDPLAFNISNGAESCVGHVLLLPRRRVQQLCTRHWCLAFRRVCT